MYEDRKISPEAKSQFDQLARTDDSALVRMHLASCLQRLTLPNRWELAEAILSRGDDADDENIPLLAWYAIEPLVSIDRQRFVALAGKSELPLVSRFIARRAASLPDSQ